MTKKNTIIVLASVLTLIFVCIGYALWYSHNRQVKIAQADKCNYEMEHPKPPIMTPSPDGSLAPVYSLEICPVVVVPPSLRDLLRGRIVFDGIPKRMQVDPYSFADILFGNYTLGPAAELPCDQSATTTPCASFGVLNAVESSVPAPYIPSNVVYPISEWISASDTPVTLSGFTFQLPAGWHGEVYEKGFSSGVHVLIQSESGAGGFTVDCPPDGKGLEAATRLSSEERTFNKSAVTYSAAFEKWTAAGNDPWYFLWIRTSEPGDPSTHTLNTVCLAQGIDDSNIKNAMRMLYETVR